MALRRCVFWCHLCAGLFAGTVVLIMSITGVLLAFEKQILAWADRQSYTPTASSAPHLPVEALLTEVARARPDAVPTTVTVRADSESIIEIGVGPGKTLFVDRTSGAILSEGSTRARAFFRRVTDWHRFLAASGEYRATGRAVTGASNLAFLFLVCSGFYLWFPRKWTWPQLRGVTWFKRGLAGRARDFNWHNTIGFWSAVPLAIVVASAVVISYSWAGDLVYRLAGEQPPSRPATSAPARPAQNVAPNASGLDAAWALAERQVADWKSISARLAGSPNGPVVITIDRGTGGQPQKRGQLTVNRRTGSVVRWEPFSAQTPGRQWRSMLRFAHTGEYWGLAGQAVAGVASAGATVLVWTGFALAWRRLLARVRRSRTAELGQPDASEARLTPSA